MNQFLAAIVPPSIVYNEISIGRCRGVVGLGAAGSFLHRQSREDVTKEEGDEDGAGDDDHDQEEDCGDDRCLFTNKELSFAFIP